MLQKCNKKLLSENFSVFLQKHIGALKYAVRTDESKRHIQLVIVDRIVQIVLFVYFRA